MNIVFGKLRVDSGIKGVGDGHMLNVSGVKVILWDYVTYIRFSMIDVILLFARYRPLTLMGRL